MFAGLAKTLPLITLMTLISTDFARRVAKKNALAQCEGVVQMSSVSIDGDCFWLEGKRLPVC